ncbi:hypothetical protein OO012_17980 [Rhodobacteraceae bacterium KMM 6894]|nr:hypothetical protein [Rhodobacteraceae bacterium KMM 6894]
MRIDAIHGTWKLGQNMIDTARLRAADHVDGYGMGARTRVLAALMKGVQPG